MKKLIIAFLLLLFAVWIGFLIHRDPGYILVTYHNWSIETSLWVGVVVVIVAFLIFYLFMRLFRHTTQLGARFQIWNRERRERKAGILTNEAFDALIEMYWRKAEELFSKSAKDSTCPIINYSAAAYAAQQLLAFDRRNKYLVKLSKLDVASQKTAKLVECYFYLHSEQWKEALTLLRQLKQKYPGDPAVIRFMAKALEALGDWEAIKNLLPAIEKNISNTEYQKLEPTVYTELLNKAIHPELLDEIWNNIPRSLRTDIKVAITYAKKAIELRRDNEAVGIIENALKKNWNADLICSYGLLKSDYTSKQISHAESWLKKRPNDPDLFVCLGRLCLREKLWGKARDYLNKAIELSASSEAHYTMGQLFEATDDIKAALEHYRAAYNVPFANHS